MIMKHRTFAFARNRSVLHCENVIQNQSFGTRERELSLSRPERKYGYVDVSLLVEESLSDSSTKSEKS